MRDRQSRNDELLACGLNGGNFVKLLKIFPGLVVQVGETNGNVNWRRGIAIVEILFS